MLPQDLHFHIHLSRNDRRPKKIADLLNSVYQLSTAAMCQFTSAADMGQERRRANKLKQLQEKLAERNAFVKD